MNLSTGTTRALLIAATLLASACVHKPPMTYGKGDPGVIHDGELYWIGNPTESQKSEWIAYHLDPSLDEREQQALSKFAWASAADSATTIAGLALCTGAAEANPVVALVPGGFLMVPLSYLGYRMVKREASRTSRYMSAERPIETATVIRGAAALSNAAVVATCL